MVRAVRRSISVVADGFNPDPGLDVVEFLHNFMDGEADGPWCDAVSVRRRVSASL